MCLEAGVHKLIGCSHPQQSSIITQITLLGIKREPVDVIRGRSAGHSDDVVAGKWDCFLLDLVIMFIVYGDFQEDDDILTNITVQYLVKKDCVNASMKHRRLIRIVHCESPNKALVHQVDALGEAVVVRIYEECAFLCVTKGARVRSRCCSQRLLRVRTSDRICSSTAKTW